ncbi:MAG: hypothetical protein DRI36_00295 [Caldiserica bacterium]|nr:MAG: hypothetical protein DRI36_00295 [Caldisericota bacterium]
MKLKEGEIYLVKGKTTIELIDGEVEIIGKKVKKGETVYVPYGKTVPVEVLSDAEVNFDNYEKIPLRTIPPEWDEVVNRILNENLKKVIVLGEVDTGKTFFSTYLSNKIIEKGKKVGIIDADLGQSDIGPPGTIGGVILEKQEIFLSEIPPTFLYFVGAHSPGLHFLPYIAGVLHVLNKLINRVDVVIIDTPGWVQGDGGRAIRRCELEVVDPSCIILLQRNDEIEHLVKIYKDIPIIRLKVSKKASSTSQEARKKLREEIARKYFKNLQKITLNFDEIETDRAYLLTGKKIEINDGNILHAELLSGWEGALVVSERKLDIFEIEKLKKEIGVFRIKNIVKGKEKNLVVGLLDEKRDVLGLGIIQEIDYKNGKFHILTPFNEKDRIKIIQFGSIKLSENIEEAGFIEPGYF